MKRIERSGKFDWTGDNPYVYLKTDPDKDWSSLSLSFTVRGSAYGVGRLMVVVEDPYRAPNSDVIRLALTDNEPLAAYLIREFVRKFRPFRGAIGLETLTATGGATFSTTGSERSWNERGEAERSSIEMSWSQLERPFAVDVPAERSGTGKHDMFSVFSMSSSAKVLVNGLQLPGHPVPRQFHHLVAPSSAVAVSETWLRRIETAPRAPAVDNA